METAPSQCLGISLRLHPTYIVQYGEFEKRSACRTESQLKAALNLRQNKPNAILSDKASKRVKNAVNWLASASVKKRVYCAVDKRTYPFHLNFITLTLPAKGINITDHQFKNQLLKNWIARMAYRHGFANYVWKVETQANGNIHAHITSDCFIHWREIRDVWNDLLIKKGYMKQFAALHGHSDPNSTDVKSVKSVKDIAAYLAKYFSKNDSDRRSVSGRLWSCSYSLSDRNPCSIHLDPQDSFDVTTPLVTSSAEAHIVQTEPDAFGNRRKVATVFFMKPSVWTEISSSLIAEHYRNRLAAIRGGERSSSLLKSNLYESECVKFDTKPRVGGAIRSDDGSAAKNLRAKVHSENYERQQPASYQPSLFDTLN